MKILEVAALSNSFAYVVDEAMSLTQTMSSGNTMTGVSTVRSWQKEASTC